uniref:CatB-related O-acetyltransferase n=1 Tax=Photobacterium leiognathi TaxID=553611 RepID=UPI0029823764
MTRKRYQLPLFLQVKRLNITLKNKAFFRRFRLPEHPIKIEKYSSILNSSRLHSIGAYSYTHSELSETSSIGRYCSIARNVQIMGDDHPLDRFTTSIVTYNNKYRNLFKQIDFSPNPKKVHIGNDVWVGEGVIFKRGVTIGDGAIIACGSIVTRDVEPYAIVGGVPAAIIRYRYSQDIINKLLQLQWWNYDLSKYQISPDCSIDDFIYQIDNIRFCRNDLKSRKRTNLQMQLCCERVKA